MLLVSFNYDYANLSGMKIYKNEEEFVQDIEKFLEWKACAELASEEEIEELLSCAKEDWPEYIDDFKDFDEFFNGEFLLCSDFFKFNEKIYHNGLEWLYNTNETIECDDINELLEMFEKVEISDSLAQNLKRIFKGEMFGYFPLR